MTTRSPRRPTRSALVAALFALLAVTAAACASTSAAVPDGPAPADVAMADLWTSLRADLMDGRSQAVEARARELAALQEVRCQKLRADLLASSADRPSALDTSALARCEDDLREYRTLARLSDRGWGMGR
jgi:hypothetical protein